MRSPCGEQPASSSSQHQAVLESVPFGHQAKRTLPQPRISILSSHSRGRWENALAGVAKPTHPDLTASVFWDIFLRREKARWTRRSLPSHYSFQWHSVVAERLLHSCSPGQLRALFAARKAESKPTPESAPRSPSSEQRMPPLPAALPLGPLTTGLTEYATAALWIITSLSAGRQGAVRPRFSRG